LGVREYCSHLGARSIEREGAQSMKIQAVLLAACVASAPATAFAAIVVDQQQGSGPSLAFFVETDLAQSFTPGASNVAGGGVFLSSLSGSGGGTVTFGLWTSLPNAAGAMELAESTVPIVGNGQWLDAFWSPVSVTPGATYFLTFDASSNYGVGFDIDNPYPNGNLFANPGYKSFPTYDFAFRTYTSTGAVPEPSTWILALAGFLGLGAASRLVGRRRFVASAP
jgi:hypothetical protein